MTAPIPLNPNGTPVSLGPIGTAGNTIKAAPRDPTGAISLWNFDSSIAGESIWYDVGQTKTTTTRLAGSSRLSPDFGVGAGGQQGKPVNTTTLSSSEIVKSPVQIMKQFAAMSANDPAHFVAFQKLLASGPWGNINATGAFDSATEKALGTAMLQYVKLSKGAGVGMSFVDYLQHTAATAQALGGDGTSLGAGSGRGSAPAVTLMDPTNIRAAAQSAATQALGQGLSEKQLATFVSQFQAEQMSNAQKGTEDPYSTSTKLPAEAMAFAQKADPAAYQQNQHDSYLDTLVNMFAPAGSQRPNMTPTPKA